MIYMLQNGSFYFLYSCLYNVFWLNALKKQIMLTFYNERHVSALSNLCKHNVNIFFIHSKIKWVCASLFKQWHLSQLRYSTVDSHLRWGPYCRTLASSQRKYSKYRSDPKWTLSEQCKCIATMQMQVELCCWIVKVHVKMSYVCNNCP